MSRFAQYYIKYKHDDGCVFTNPPARVISLE